MTSLTDSGEATQPGPVGVVWPTLGSDQVSCFTPAPCLCARAMARLLACVAGDCIMISVVVKCQVFRI